MIQFGLFLVDRGRIDAEQFVQALKRQLSGCVPLGQLAIDRGYLSAKQVFQVVVEQTESQELFGETAVRLGFLSRAQLAELLLEQANRYPKLADVFVEQETLTERAVREEMKAYRAHMAAQTAEQDEETISYRVFEPIGAE